MPPARDAQTRDSQTNETEAGEKYAGSAGGQGSFVGSHAGGTHSGASSETRTGSGYSAKGDSYDTSSSGGAFSDTGADKPDPNKISSSSGNDPSFDRDLKTSSGDSSGGSSGGTGSDAPGYVSSVTQPFGSSKPKGNVTEGSEEDFRGPNTQDAEIGSERDPGRRAEAAFQRMTQQSSGSSAPRQGGATNEGQYGVLEGDQGL